MIFMRIGLIGCGFIGTTLAKAIDKMGEIETLYLFDHSESRAQNLAASIQKAVATSNFSTLVKKSDLVIEAASQLAVKTYSREVLSKGKDLMIMSVGALVDDLFWTQLQKEAKRHKCHIYLPSGAICGIDGIRAASMAKIDEVMLTSTKPPKSLKNVKYIADRGINLDSLKAPLVVFEGPAKDAVKQFPKNINVSALVSLAGIGFKNTKVKIIADPATSRNTHEITVKGRFGEIHCRIDNMPSLTNPKTSYLAALAPIATLKKIVSGVWIGN